MRGHHSVGGALGGLFETVRRVADLDSTGDWCAIDGAGPLLHDMYQLVRKHALARVAVGRELIGLEDDIVADRVGVRLDRTRRLGRLSIGMDPDVAEVSAQAGFHKSAGIPIERRPAARADNVFDERRLLLLEGGTDAGIA